jgi:hypothetical protein
MEYAGLREDLALLRLWTLGALPITPVVCQDLHTNPFFPQSAEDDVPSSAGRDQIVADEDEREQHQDEIERVHRQHTIMLRLPWSRKPAN